MLTITNETVIYFAAFTGTIAFLGILVTLFILYSDRQQIRKHKHA
ncbi:MAG: hypothetical protein QME05_02395 [Candidatus Margulisbacteria bacterium]|nr:hypothetical protein [Candidatus Margulisiibacteriota bacterium]